MAHYSHSVRQSRHTVEIRRDLGIRPASTLRSATLWLVNSAVLASAAAAAWPMIYGSALMTPPAATGTWISVRAVDKRRVDSGRGIRTPTKPYVNRV